MVMRYVGKLFVKFDYKFGVKMDFKFWYFPNILRLILVSNYCYTSWEVWRSAMHSWGFDPNTRSWFGSRVRVQNLGWILIQVCGRSSWYFLSSGSGLMATCSQFLLLVVSNCLVHLVDEQPIFQECPLCIVNLRIGTIGSSMSPLYSLMLGICSRLLLVKITHE